MYLCHLVYLVILISILSPSNGSMKYSKQLNQKDMFDKGIEKPFRMLKLNVLWEKAIKRFSGQKLKNLKDDLKAQDKDEIALKRFKAEGQDKDGLKEAEIRRNLLRILKKYELQDEYKVNTVNNDITEMLSEKQVFKDKKLDKLWKKAEKSGFDDEQLKILKEEFKHHQDNIDEYYKLIRDHEEVKANLDDSDNHIDNLGENNNQAYASIRSQQALKEKHEDIKRNFDSLKIKIREKTVNLNAEFEEENVQNLWELAKKSDFNKEELESLREELNHYQIRIKKLKYFEEQLHNEHLQGKNTYNQKDDIEGMSHLKSKVKDLNYKVNKIHGELESRIMRRHIDL